MPLKVTVVAVNVRFSLKIAELSKVMFSLALTFLQPSVAVSLKVMFPSVDLTSAPTVASPVKTISFTAVTAPFTVAVPLTERERSLSPLLEPNETPASSLNSALPSIVTLLQLPVVWLTSFPPKVTVDALIVIPSFTRTSPP